jgi:electron transfer flavoprotein alpha subunit|tara:strand:+ start:591 stop:1535 length:945 start_codon:yes stop_codon:yes gene_type:complete
MLEDKFMKILVLAEINDGELAEDQTSKTVSAATSLGKVDVLCASNSCTDASKKIASMENVEKVFVIEDDIFSQSLAESYSETLIDTVSSYSHVFAPSSSFGKNILPRIGGVLDAMVISDVSKIISSDTFERPIYAGNAIQTVQSIDKVKLVSVRTSNFDSVPLTGSADIEKIECATNNTYTTFVENKIQPSDRPELTSAKVVVSGGRGVGSKENFEIIEGLADKLGAAVGASRAAVDSGFAPNDWQVGQTGKVVAPDLYVAVGISGAIQHLAGMKDSKVIVAINKDEEAPIFQVADFGLVDDLFKAVPEIEKKI